MPKDCIFLVVIERKRLLNVKLQSQAHGSLQLLLAAKPVSQGQAHTKPANPHPLTKSASFWNRPPVWFNAPSTRNRVRKYAVLKMCGFVWTGKSLIKNDRDQQVLWALETWAPHPKPLFSIKPLDARTWLGSLLSKVFLWMGPQSFSSPEPVVSWSRGRYQLNWVALGTRMGLNDLECHLPVYFYWTFLAIRRAHCNDTSRACYLLASIARQTWHHSETSQEAIRKYNISSSESAVGFQSTLSRC